MLIAATTATTTAATTTGGSSGGAGSFIFPIMLLALAALWLIVIRPKQRRQREARTKLADVALGDEIITAGGLYGTVTQVGEDEVSVEIAPNVEVRLARRAIAAQLTEPAPAEEPETAEPESGAENPG
jgi:preprotein translocase subunit YajC